MSRPYDTKLWKQRRSEILARDNHTCQIGYPEVCKGRADVADHIIQWQLGGDRYDPSNLRAACRPCNTRRHFFPEPNPTPSRNW